MYRGDPLQRAIIEQKMKDPEKSVTGLSAYFRPLATQLKIAITKHSANKIYRRAKRKLSQ